MSDILNTNIHIKHQQYQLIFDILYKFYTIFFIYISSLFLENKVKYLKYEIQFYRTNYSTKA